MLDEAQQLLHQQVIGRLQQRFEVQRAYRLHDGEILLQAFAIRKSNHARNAIADR